MVAGDEKERLARIETKIDFIAEELLSGKHFRAEAEKRFQAIEKRVLALSIISFVGGSAATAVSQIAFKLFF